MERSVVETVIGAIVVLVAIGFGYFAYNSSSITQRDGYGLTAKFDSVDGLSLGSDVRIGGVKVGVVGDLYLDAVDYLAITRLIISEDITLPMDSTAAVVSDGLLGSKYVSLTPGGSDEVLKDGAEITFTQSSVNFESLLGKFMFSGNSDGNAAAPAPAAVPEPAVNNSDELSLSPQMDEHGDAADESSTENDNQGQHSAFSLGL